MSDEKKKNGSTVELCVVGDEVEAMGMESLFAEEGIEVYIFKRRDTAGPGVFDREVPWGVARVAEADFERARNLWTTWLEAPPAEIGEAWQEKPKDENDESKKRETRGATGWFFFVLGVAVGCIAMYALLAAKGSL